MTRFFALAALFACLLSNEIHAAEAFGYPGQTPNWSSAKKINVGTFYETGGKPRSPIWFTQSEGVLTELYFPTIDRAQIKDSQIVVTDGKTFFMEERKDLKHRIRVISPAFAEIINEDPKGRFEIRHLVFTMSDQPAVVDQVTVISKVPGLKFYLLTNPHLENTGKGDSAKLISQGFQVEDGATQMEVTTNVGFSEKSVGFVGQSDGWQDLHRDFKMDYRFDSARKGNVALTGRIQVPETVGTHRFSVTYSFSSHGHRLAEGVSKNLDAQRELYIKTWDNYLKTVRKLSKASEAENKLYLRSLYTLKCHEDKLNPGALIASLSIPWGEKQYENNGTSVGGYHLIWPRDLYHVAMALLWAGDLDSPMNALRFLKKIQYRSQAGTWDLNPRKIKKEGAFPQNAWVSGDEYWGGLQLDQVGYPVHLFYQIYRKVGPTKQREMLLEFDDMITKALKFIQKFGPWTHQERWEENFGISPSSFSVAASALKIGAILYRDEFGRSLSRTADTWLNKPGDNIDTWTFTTTGSHGDGHYYLRIGGCQNYGATWDPNNKADCHVANSSKRVSPDEFLDQGFLKLALLGLRKADDWKLITSQDKINQAIRVKTPNGYGWYRYKHDAYGENDKGRLWPLLSSEHGRFAIERARAGSLSWKVADKKVEDILKSYVGFANEGMMIPEQVWENTGEGTGAATPLAWSHAEFIKLLIGRELKHNVENPF